MKRLLALILALAFSITNNVDFQASGETHYSRDSYYKIAEGDAPDYRYLTRNYSNLTSSGNCVGKPLQLSRAVSLHLDSMGIYRYWLDYSMTSDDISEDDVRAMTSAQEYTFTEETWIVAPQKCVVETKSTDGGGHYMRITTADGKWTFVIENMERWFCCRNRSVDADADVMNTSWTHTVNVAGSTIPGGYGIGRAVDGTTFTVLDSTGRVVSLSSYYSS